MILNDPAVGRLSCRLIRLCATTLFVLATVSYVRAQSDSGEEVKGPQRKSGRHYASYETRFIVLHTDLPDDSARLLCKRMGRTLQTVSRYWGRKSSNPIECYVVDNLDNWRESDFPHVCAWTMIGGVGGGAFAEHAGTSRGASMKVTVYASSRAGIVEHELVHAYCGQAFGETGPDWYKEGMAEMPFQSRHGETSVQCRRDVIQYLHKGPIPSVHAIVNSGRMNRQLRESLEGMQADTAIKTVEEKSRQLHQWVLSNGASVRSARNSYRWCWALCHFLTQNPNYSQRFRLLGRGYLNRRNESFHHLFGSMQQELDFEYRFFLDRIDVGYRVDLCRWNWKRKFQTLEAARVASVRIKAARGYQPTGARIRRGRAYLFESSGRWQVDPGGLLLQAEGDPERRGRLVGVVMSNYRLSLPFDLGRSGTFVAPSDGELYLRCRDKWNELADNQGSMSVRIRARPAEPPADR